MSKERSVFKSELSKAGAYLVGGLVILGISIALINEALSVSAV